MKDPAEHHTEMISLMQKRFEFIRAITDSAISPPQRGGSHQAEIYKSALKAFARSDRQIVEEYALRLATAEFSGGVHLIWAMLHLPQDSREKGSWHRDGDSSSKRVFWFPLTEYQYNGLSYVPFSTSPALSRSVCLLGSMTGRVPYSKNLTRTKDTFYSWSSNLVHMGNLNTSDRLSCALQVFLDKSIQDSPPEHLITYDHKTILGTAQLVRRGLIFDERGALSHTHKDVIAELPESFKGFFLGIFKTRTGVDPLDYA
jgi:hypothetical protein